MSESLVQAPKVSFFGFTLESSKRAVTVIANGFNHFISTHASLLIIALLILFD